jgi:hypothetical protein
VIQKSYILVSAEDVTSFETRVRLRIQEGYVPTGGVSLTIGKYRLQQETDAITRSSARAGILLASSVTLYQAMVLKGVL